MALNVGTLPDPGVYAGSTEVQQVYVGADLVWESRETVTITGTSGTQARDSFRAALTARGLNYATVKTIPFLLDTSNVTNMDSIFRDCAALTSVPEMDTSNVTNMYGMFRDCAALTLVPQMDTSNVTDMNRMFAGCAVLTSVPDMNTSNVTDMTYMFSGCAALTDGNVRLVGKKSGVNTRNMLNKSGLTRLPFYDVVKITGTSGTEARDSFRAALTARGLDYKTIKTVPFLLDTSNVTRISNMFDDCAALTSVPDMDTSQVTIMSNMFYNCSSLTSVPNMNTSNVTNMYQMFYNCSSLTSVPNMNTGNVANISYMFYKCAALTDGSVRCIGKKSGVNTSGMITNSGLTRLPFYDTNGNWTG